ncbi:MAG: acyl-CoA synthetase [Thalassobaculaceae bacterium]|nr:acyl-CoA synthetase [Thalassobaculaceae bacterium]
MAHAARADGAPEDFDWAIPDSFNFATDVVDRWAADGDPLALIWQNAAGEERLFRFSDISRLTKRVAHAMAEAGIVKGDRILVVMPRIPEWQIAMVAAMRIGAVPIPCIEMLTAREVAYRAKHSGAVAVMCRAGHAGKIEPGLDGVALRFSVGSRDGWRDMTEAYDRPQEAKAATIGAEEPAVMYYTSGSTGYPKGVVHAARAVFGWRYAARYWLDLTPGERIWCGADTGWSKAGTSVLIGPWSEGATSFHYDGPFDPKERLALLAKHRITVYCAPATELYRVVQEDIAAFDLSALRRTVSAGEAMNPVVAAKWTAATGVPVAEAYGQTETLMTALTTTDVAPKLGSMGVAAPGCTLAVIGDDGTRLPDGAAGHVALLTPSPTMMLGYWNEPERTAQSFVDGPDGRWFLTGDLASRDSDGYFWYAGRSDDVINSAGYRIGPIEVENAVLEHEAVLECAVVGAPDPERGEIVTAYIVLKRGVAPDDALVAAIQNHVKSATAPYKYPRRIEFRTDLPKGHTGKVLRRALRDEARAQTQTQSGG